MDLGTRELIWLVPAVFYAIFCLWYTDWRGKLRPEEIEAFIDKLEKGGGRPEILASLRRFMERDSGRQFLMVNIMEMAKHPPQVEGAQVGESAEQLMGRYMEHMWPQLLKRGCHPVLMGEAVHSVIDLSGIEGAEQWDAAALFRYRSRRTLMQVVAIPETRARHAFKLAALAKTIAFPIETKLYLCDPRFLLALVLIAGVALAEWAL